MVKMLLDIDSETQARIDRIAMRKGVSPEEAATYILERRLFGIDRKVAIPYEEYVPQHIPIMLDRNADRVLKSYRCNVCGNVVFNYYGGVKLIANGEYDADNNMIDGDDMDWFKNLGVPDEIVCGGRIIVQYADGHTGKIRCSTVYYKIGA